MLAADSKLIQLGDHRKLGGKCKIFRCGSYYVAIAGPDGANDALDFRPRLLVSAVCRRGLEPAELIVAAEEVLLPAYTTFTANVRRVDPAFYGRSFSTRELFFNWVMVGFDGGFPFIRTLDLAPPAAGGATVGVTRRAIASPVPARTIQHTFVGGDDELNALANESESLWRFGLVEASRYLVVAAGLRRPVFVGPPVDVLRITKDGADWVQRKAECVENDLGQSHAPAGKSRRAARRLRR